MNDFSLVCRVLGTLFYRQPQDEVLSPLLTLIAQNKLAEHWPLKQDALLTRMQQECVPETLQQDFQALFCGETPKVSPTDPPGWTPTNGTFAPFCSPAVCPAVRNPPTTLARCCWPVPGLKIRRSRMKPKHNGSFLTVFF
ncbi:Tat proofreading chaperone DmsD [Sodalis praecaptivus]